MELARTILAPIKTVLEKVKRDEPASVEELAQLGDWSFYGHHAGFAIENLAKGIFVKKKRPVARGRLPRDLDSHDVAMLLHLSEIQVSREEHRLVQALRVYVEWMGRYPVPKEADSMWRLIRVESGGTRVHAPPDMLSESDVARIEQLFTRLDHELQ